MNCPHCKHLLNIDPQKIQQFTGFITCPNCSRSFDAYEKLTVTSMSTTTSSPTLAPKKSEASTTPVLPSNIIADPDLAAPRVSAATEAVVRHTGLKPTASTPPLTTHSETVMDAPNDNSIGLSEKSYVDKNLFWSLMLVRIKRLAMLVTIGVLMISLVCIGIYAKKDTLTKTATVGPLVREILHRLAPDTPIRTLTEDVILSNVRSSPLPNERGVRISFTLKSTAAIALDTPAICLTLLDIHDTPVGFRKIAFKAPQAHLSAMQNLDSDIDIVPLHETTAIMVALQLNTGDGVCVEDTKIPLSQ